MGGGLAEESLGRIARGLDRGRSASYRRCASGPLFLIGDYSFSVGGEMLIVETSTLVRDDPGTSIRCVAYRLIGECMTNQDHLPQGPPLGLTPILAVSDAHAAIAFYSQAFGATEIARISAPDAIRLMHVRMTVFGTVFVFMDEIPELAGNGSRFHSPDRLNGTSVSLHLQVADAKLVWTQALTAGAVPIIPLAEQFWGELYGRLMDPFGHEWTIAQQLQILGPAEVESAAAAVLRPQK